MQHTGYTKRTCNKPQMGHMQDEWHVQHTWHIQDAGHMNEVGHNQRMGYTQCELYMQYRWQTERTVHTQNRRNPLHMCHTRDCKLCCCHQHNASTWLGWTIAPVSRLMMLSPSVNGTPGFGFWRGGCPESKPLMVQGKERMSGFRLNRCKFQSPINSAINSSDRQQHCSSTSQ